MRRVLLISALILTAAASCIRNDVPYPVRVTSISKMEVEQGTVTLDPDNRFATVTLAEQADIKNVRIKSMEFSDEMTSISPEPSGIFDLSRPVIFKLSTYQDYYWTVFAVQPIERYFKVRSQVGESTIDEVNRRVMLEVSKTVPLQAVEILEAKLGPAEITTCTPALSGSMDFSEPVSIELRYRDVVETWIIFVEHTDVSIKIKSVNPWTRVAHLSAEGIEGSDNGFCWRKKGDVVWNEEKCGTSGAFSVSIDNLEPETEYEFYAYSGSEKTDKASFTTDADVQLPNAGLEFSSKSKSGTFMEWYNPVAPDPLCRTPWWGSGNGSDVLNSEGNPISGSADFGGFIISEPDNVTFHEGTQSAHLCTTWALVKLAAGNIFTGHFAGLIGTAGGVVNFGRPFTHRPRALKFWMIYKPGRINRIGTIPEGSNVKEGDYDTGRIFIALGDWNYREYGGDPDCPVAVNTTDKATFFRRDSDAVIAYGEHSISKDTGGWVEVEIPLEYTSLSRVPTHIIISCAASNLGDYFTGSDSTEMWVDDFRLIY